MTSWIRKWVPLLSLVAIPVAQAQNAGAMDSAKQATVATTQSATPTEEAQAKQIEVLQREVAALKAQAAEAPVSWEVRDQYLTDEEAHPLYP